jgi:hypothetical protein
MGCLISREEREFDRETKERRNNMEMTLLDNKTLNQIKTDNNRVDNIIRSDKSHIEVNNSESNLLDKQIILARINYDILIQSNKNLMKIS